MPGEIGVFCESTSTTMLVEPLLAAHVWADEQSCDGGQPPHVPPHPSPPQVFPVQSGLHCEPPPSEAPVVEADAAADPVLLLEAPALDNPADVLRWLDPLATDAPVVAEELTLTLPDVRPLDVELWSVAEHAWPTIPRAAATEKAHLDEDVRMRWHPSEQLAAMASTPIAHCIRAAPADGHDNGAVENRPASHDRVVTSAGSGDHLHAIGSSPPHDRVTTSTRSGRRLRAIGWSPSMDRMRTSTRSGGHLPWIA